jgi:hypothetical protein
LTTLKVRVAAAMLSVSINNAVILNRGARARLRIASRMSLPRRLPRGGFRAWGFNPVFQPEDALEVAAELFVAMHDHDQPLSFRLPNDFHCFALARHVEIRKRSSNRQKSASSERHDVCAFLFSPSRSRAGVDVALISPGRATGQPQEERLLSPASPSKLTLSSTCPMK